MKLELRICQIFLKASLALLLLCIFACSTSEEKLTLLSPVNTVIKPVITTFEWSNVSIAYQFELWEKDVLIIDSTLSEPNIELSKLLKPKTSYRWSVMTESQKQETFFVTEDVISSYAGVYAAKAHRSCFGPLPNCDTLINTQLEIIKNGEELIVKEPFTGMKNSNKLILESGNDYQLSYQFTFRPESRILINLATDTITASYCACGLGGGRFWRFEAVKM